VTSATEELDTLSFESYVRLYFGSDDIYRRLNLIDSYLTVGLFHFISHTSIVFELSSFSFRIFLAGVNRDTTAEQLIENLHNKMKSRVPPEQMEGFYKFHLH
jgi:hypothetical protein